MWESFCDLRLGNGFLVMTAKTQMMKNEKKESKGTIPKLKT